MVFQAVFKKIPLLPKIKISVKYPLQLDVRITDKSGGFQVHLQHAIQRRGIKRHARIPRFLPKAPEIEFAQILHPDQSVSGVMVINLGNGNSCGLKESRDIDIVAIFLLLAGVFHKNHRFPAHAHAVELSFGATLLKGDHGRALAGIERKSLTRQRDDIGVGKHGYINWDNGVVVFQYLPRVIGKPNHP